EGRARHGVGRGSRRARGAERCGLRPGRPGDGGVADGRRVPAPARCGGATVTLFEYHARVIRGASGVNVTVRAETWQEAREALVSSLPELWRREGVDTRFA